MTDRKLYEQKMQAQIDEWQAEIDKLKAKASGASADAQLELNKQVDELQSKVDQGKDKLSELAAASDDAWESVKDGVESAWGSLDSAFRDAAARFKS